MCIILNQEKTTLPTQNIFGANFYILGQILNLRFKGKFYFWGAFFYFGQFCVWEILNLYLGLNFFS